jgi:hypothetical protein
MVQRLLLVLLGAFHIANGLWMLAAPDSWYATVPGVPMTGPINHHFIYDVGMAFVASGSLLALSALPDPRMSVLAAAGALWPALHALIHIAGWFMNGFPSRSDIAFSEAIGVVGLAVLGLVLSWFRWNGET